MADTRIHHVTLPGLRLHLRKGDPNLLWINGRDMLILNDTAADFIEAFIETMSHYRNQVDVSHFKQEIARWMQRKYPLALPEVLIKDFDSIYGSILEISRGSCPITETRLGTRETIPQQWTAPLRMDLALTYRCNNNCYYCYTGGPQKVEELMTWDWKTVLDTLWENGIPQVVFTGGEPTLREDLVELVDHAQSFVTGLVTNGRKLAELASRLKQVSLDYVQVSLESYQPEVHDRMVGVEGAWEETTLGIRRAVDSGLEVITNTTLTSDNLAIFPDLVKTGPEMGLKMMACNTLICSGRGMCSKQDRGVSMEDLKAALSAALNAAEKAGIRLEWYSPTCYKQFNPLEYGFGVKACSAAQYNMTVEPDGSVIPCQSWYKDRLGNILKDSWKGIWNHPVSKGLREKSYLENREECEGCEYLASCAGGCPLEYSS
jgi:radical SAM protein with 4Fe4S-binding SPASM domain